MRSGAASGWRYRPLSTASTALWRNGCAGPMPTRTCPALHGWRRYGKRSPAPRATPRITIWNENRWFSRCSRCLRTRRGRRQHRPNHPVRAPYKDFRVGKEAKKKEKGRQARHKSRHEETRREEGREGHEEGCEKSSQEG